MLPPLSTVARHRRRITENHRATYDEWRRDVSDGINSFVDIASPKSFTLEDQSEVHHAKDCTDGPN